MRRNFDSAQPFRPRHDITSMRPRLCLVVAAIALLLFSSTIASAQETFPSIAAFLKSTVKGQDRLSTQARGDLNGDGIRDWVGVIKSQETDAAPTYQLYLLLGQRNGAFRVDEKTEKAEIPGMGCCWLEDLAIRRGSIFVQNNAKTASVMEAATHQFKFHKGKWRLIGLTIYLTDHTPGAEKTNDTEMNFLTGLVIEKTRKGDKRQRVHRRRQQFPVSLLRDYDFSNGFGTE